jgi:hypothetical protein
LHYFMAQLNAIQRCCPLRLSVQTLALVLLFAREGSAADEPVDYLSQVKPILAERCFACHGALKQEGGLRLDTAALAIKGGDSGAAVTPGEAEASLLLKRVAASDIADRMPPESEGEGLSAPQIDRLRSWIAAGASAPADERPDADPREHWAFRPLARPAVPSVRRQEWVRNPIDAFVARQHEQRELAPQPEAPRLALLRRLSLDLIGLPPTPQAIAAFQNDSAADWYEREVDCLLDDPRHGQRWARHWMDVWRYSDWWGLGDQLRNSQPHIWHWRDWIVESLNADTPYDEMVRLMLAADEYYPNDLDKLRATGYLARNYFLFNRNQWMDETVEHASKAFLGLTMNCAKCHDHKYDPIRQTDFYRMRAFFEPYHVRIDMLPGEADLARDGIPRAFDGLPELPTYRFIRGDEKNPDQSTTIAPGVPAVLEFAPLSIAPVELPLEAWQPGRRPWVAEAYRAAARKKIEAAEAKLGPAREKLAAAQSHEAALVARLKADEASPEKNDAAGASSDRPAIVEKFATLDHERWKLFGGDWSHEPGRLEQKRDGAQRAVLRLLAAAPRDFDASVRFTIRGGSQWRSVGIVFDSAQADPSAEPGPSDSEQMVYVSAYAGGPKVQAAFHRGGNWQYPAEGTRALAIELDREYTLRVKVRDMLINAWLDGTPVIAWRSPLPRAEGAFQLISFDALAVFHEVSLAPLADGVVLREPGAPPSPDTPALAAEVVVESQKELQISELALAVAQAEFQRIEGRAVAMAADENEAGRAARRAAAGAEAEWAAAQARLGLAEAELRLARSPADKRDAVAMEVAKASETLEQALRRVAEPGEQYTQLSGAQWTATRFFNSLQDDPTVTFQPRSTGRRKALAEWITDRRNPLTARVAVNHLWARHLGTPLVPTVFDFGRKGSPPANPELLEWLASELIESGWSMKHVHRLIVESATYRLSSSVLGAEANLARDPDNVYLWRRTPVRLESQAVRDSILDLADQLDPAFGGPPVPPAGQDESRRRSLYFFHSNNERNRFLTTFDDAMVRECYRREQSIVPQQALALVNSRLVLDASLPIAQRLTQELAAKAQAARDDAFVRLAFAVLLGSEASEAEVAAGLRSLMAWKGQSESQDPVASNSYARTNLIWVLLNHHDFVTVR